MDQAKSFCNWMYKTTLARWILDTKDTETEKVARLAQEIYDSVKHIVESIDCLERIISQQLDEDLSEFQLDENCTLSHVFDRILKKYEIMKRLFHKVYNNNEQILTNKVQRQDCLAELLDEKVTYGRKLKIIKEHCKEEDIEFLIVQLAIVYELGVRKHIPEVLKICRILDNSEFGVLPFNTLLRHSYEIQQEVSNDKQIEYKRVIAMLEAIVKILGPVCDEFTLKVSRLSVALDTRYKTGDE